VLHHHRDALLPKDLVEVFYHLGECNRRLGHVDQAKNFYAKALEIDGTHRPTIFHSLEALQYSLAFSGTGRGSRSSNNWLKVSTNRVARCWITSSTICARRSRNCAVTHRRWVVKCIWPTRI